MEETSLDFHLIAHSHGVSLLDGITNWREKVRSPGANDPRYGAAFQGWFDGSITGEPFETLVTNSSVPLSRFDAWVISSGNEVGQLAVINDSSGSSVLYVNEKLTSILQVWDDALPIVSMLNGNDYALMMLNRLPAYDFIDQDVQSLAVDVPIIDEIFIDHQVNTWISATYHALIAIRKSGSNQLIHVLPPPPRESPHLSKHFEIFPAEVLAKGFAPDSLRLKWYRRYCRKLTECLTTINCMVVTPPLSACNERGLLKEEFAEGLTHGNKNYGVLVGNQIASVLQRAAS